MNEVSFFFSERILAFTEVVYSACLINTIVVAQGRPGDDGLRGEPGPVGSKV